MFSPESGGVAFVINFGYQLEVGYNDILISKNVIDERLLMNSN